MTPPNKTTFRPVMESVVDGEEGLLLSLDAAQERAHFSKSKAHFSKSKAHFSKSK